MPRIVGTPSGWRGGLAMKLERTAVSLEEQELMELEAIVQDEDTEAALEFLRRLRKRVLEIQRRHGC